MAGIMPALETHHDVGLLGQPVDDLALALVTPLGSDDDHVGHEILLFPAFAATTESAQAFCSSGRLSQCGPWGQRRWGGHCSCAQAVLSRMAPGREMRMA